MEVVAAGAEILYEPERVTDAVFAAKAITPATARNMKNFFINSNVMY